jgi:hypothetical protein
MPELSRFYGIIILMFSEPSERHHVPHFHAYYGEHVAVFGRNFTTRSYLPTGAFWSKAASLPQFRLCSSLAP